MRMSRLRLRQGLSRSLPRRAALRVSRISPRRCVVRARADVCVSFRIKHHVHYGERLAILGSSAVLGSWQRDKALPLNWTDGDIWTSDCNFNTEEAVEYKYVRINGDGEVQEWSPGSNRQINFGLLNEDGMIAQEDTWSGKSSPKTSDDSPSTVPTPQPTAKKSVGRQPVPSLIDESSHSNGGSHEIDIGGPFDAPVTRYTVEQNSILASLIGRDAKLPEFPVSPW